MPPPPLDPDHGDTFAAMVSFRRQLMEKVMTGSEQMFLVLTIGAFALFGVVLAYVDTATARERNKRRG